jgi:ubiquinone/menaquinone biosynthesis C-methylase UbiE
MGDAFDERWRRNVLPQTTTEEDFWAKTGWRAQDLRGKVVLDAGCGCGRFAQIAARYAERVVAVDLSGEAVAATRANVPRADTRRDDLLALSTVPDESVDLAYALGTLHHTGDTRRAFFEVARKVKVGGELVVWIYEKPARNETSFQAIQLLHEVTREVAPDKLYEIFQRHAPKLRDLYQKREGKPHQSDFLQQVLRISTQEDDQDCISDTFDWHAPWYRDWIEEDDLTGWFRFEGFEINWSGAFPVTVKGVKQAQKHVVRPLADPRPANREDGEKSRPRTLLVSDVRGWAFDQNMQDLEQYLGSDFQIEHGYVYGWVTGAGPAPDFREYDVVYLLYHRFGIEPWVPADRVVGSLRSQVLFPERQEPVGQVEKEVLDKYVAFHVTNHESYVKLSALRPDILYLPNPVNMRRFPAREAPPARRVTFEWNGNAHHSNKTKEDVKGFHSIIVPAVKRAQVPLEFAEYNTCRLSPEEMPGFYSRADVALCASSYEGSSNSTLEAMAAGLALVTTDVGNHREMQERQLEQWGDSGIVIVERSINAFVHEVRRLASLPERVWEMGLVNRKEIEARWSWDVWAEGYRDFLRAPVR